VSKPVAFDRLFDLLVDMIDSRFFVSGGSIETRDTIHEDFSDSSINIPELDVTEALKNHNGNSLLFTNLLGDFVHYYQDAPLKLQEHISAGDLESAARLAHNVAGVAGSFAAKDLMTASRELEHAITTGTPEQWQPLLSQFERHINALIASIKLFKGDVTKLH
jgi:HPt (histidine-containing phosphotransfer) domain-containing protein